MPRVLIQVDAGGEWPVVVNDGDEPPGGAGVTFRYVCDVGTIAEGDAVRSAWLRRRVAPEVRAARAEDAADRQDR
jgi:hypothetical protein